MSKQHEADLILKLYELRRESTLRHARDWYIRNFFPETLADFEKTMFSEHSGHLRMVMSYWDMAAALVNHGAISIDLFNDVNGEHFGVFARLEPILGEVRGMLNPHFMMNLEKLIDATPEGRARVARVRQQYKGFMEKAKAMNQAAATVEQN